MRARTSKRSDSPRLPPWCQKVVEVANRLVQTDSQDIGQLSRNAEHVIMYIEGATHDLVRVREECSAAQRTGAKRLPHESGRNRLAVLDLRGEGGNQPLPFDRT